MSNFARPLDIARRDLDRRAQAADKAGDWRETAILFPLTTVADMVCRIGDHTHSTHYRADKSGDLADAARRVEAESLRAYAGDDGNEDLDAAAEVLGEVASAVRRATWIAARQANGSGAEVYASDAALIRRAQHAFARWADAVCAHAVPEPTEDD